MVRASVRDLWVVVILFQVPVLRILFLNGVRIDGWHFDRHPHDLQMASLYITDPSNYKALGHVGVNRSTHLTNRLGFV